MYMCLVLYVVMTGCIFRLRARLEECVCHDSDVMSINFFTSVRLDRMFVRVVYFMP